MKPRNVAPKPPSAPADTLAAEPAAPPLTERRPVYLATAYDKANPTSEAMAVLEADPGLLVLHPLFNWADPTRPKEVMDFFGVTVADLPVHKNRWAQMIERDYWLIARCSIMVYDLDHSPGEQFLAAAVIYKKPVILVSRDFAALSFGHFAGFVRMSVKPEDVASVVKLLVRPVESAQAAQEKALARTGGVATPQPTEPKTES